MYQFNIKETGPDLNIVLTRAMFSLAAIAALVFSTGDQYYLNIGAAICLLIASVFLKPLMLRYKVQKMVLVSVATLLLFIATRSVAMSLVLLLYGFLVKYLNKPPIIQFSESGILIKKLMASPAYPWNAFSNIILKDGLLTLDFKNNKLLQVNIEDSSGMVDEIKFNSYCRGYI